jgi:hypothetical protein
VSSAINSNNHPLKQPLQAPFQPKVKASAANQQLTPPSSTVSAVAVGSVVAQNQEIQPHQDTLVLTQNALPTQPTTTTPSAFNVTPREANFPFLGRFQQQVLGVSTHSESTEKQDETEYVDPISIPSLPSSYDNYLPALCDPTTDPSCRTETVAKAKSQSARKVMQAAITTLNAGLFLQNAATVVRSIVLAQIPQTFTFAGSSINLLSLFLPAQARLPAFVAGLSLSMGGASLALSQARRCNVDRLDNTLDAYKTAMNPMWKDSAKVFPYPGYLRYKDGQAIGTFHMLHPGSMAMLAREQYDTVFNKMTQEWKLPKRLSFVADLSAGAWQLLWMNGKMLSDPTFAYDALRFVPRAEFVRGGKYTMCNAPEYALAIGAVAPLVLMAGALVVEGFQNAKTGLEKKFDPTKPNTQTIDPNSAEAKAKKQALFQKSTPLQLAANVSAILPALANLMFVPAIAVAASGNPIQSITKGTNVSYKITPKLDATLIKVGSIGAISSALVSTASGMGWMPKVFSDTADLLFLAFSALSGWGLSRNTLATEPRTTQVEHKYPNADQHRYISNKNSYISQKRGMFSWLTDRFGKVDPTMVPELPGDPTYRA